MSCNYYFISRNYILFIVSVLPLCGPTEVLFPICLLQLVSSIFNFYLPDLYLRPSSWVCSDANLRITTGMYSPPLFPLPLAQLGHQDIWRTWCFWRAEKPRRHVNLSSESSYANSQMDWDEKTDLDDVLYISKPTPAYIKMTSFHSEVWIVRCILFQTSPYHSRTFDKGSFDPASPYCRGGYPGTMLFNLDVAPESLLLHTGDCTNVAQPISHRSRLWWMGMQTIRTL